MEVISLYLFMKQHCVAFFSVVDNELVTSYLHNSTILRNSTHFKTLKSAYLFPKAHT